MLEHNLPPTSKRAANKALNRTPRGLDLDQQTRGRGAEGGEQLERRLGRSLLSLGSGADSLASCLVPNMPPPPPVIHHSRAGGCD